MPTILTVGPLHVDLITHLPRCPAAGETRTITSTTPLPGSSTLTHALTIQRLSRASPTAPSPSDITVRLLSRVGADAHADLLLAPLTASGVSTAEITRIPDAPTGTALVLVEDDTGATRTLVNPGANAALRPKVFRDDFFAYDGCGLVVMTMEMARETVERVAELADKDFVPVMLSVAGARAVDAGAVPARYVVVREEVAGGLESAEKGEEMAAAEKKLGAVNVVVWGRKGCYYMGREEEEKGFVAAGEGEGEGEAECEVDGGVFVGALAVAVCEYKEWGEAVKWAWRAAGVRTGREGVDRIPWRGEVEPEEEGGEGESIKLDEETQTSA